MFQPLQTALPSGRPPFVGTGGARAATPSFRAEIAALLPRLRAFAYTLCWRRADADDLLHDTIVRALTKAHLFEPGTNLRAWLMTVMRNEFYSSLRRTRPEVEDVNGVHAERLSIPAQQAAGLGMQDFERALARLPVDQREALMLVGAAGHSYDEAAAICGVAVGTIKSRVHRARQTLIAALGLEDGTDLDLNH